MAVSINSYTTHSSAPVSKPSLCIYKPYTEGKNFDDSGIIVKSGIATPFALNTRIMDLLTEYAALQDNWDQDNALAPTSEIIKHARYLTELLERRGQSIYHAAPGPSGEIMLDLRDKTKTKSVEIILYPDRAVAVFFSDMEKPKQQEFKVGKVAEILQWLNK